MGIVLDVVILAIFALSVFLGYKKGIIGVIFNLVAFIIAIVITIFLCDPITNYVVENTQIYNDIRNNIVENVKNDDKSEKENSTYIQKYIEENMKNTNNEIIAESSEIIARKIISIGVSIVIFIGVRIILFVIKFIIEGVATLPVIKQFNEIGGATYGVIRGIILVYAILTIMYFVVSINNTGMISQTIESSVVSKILYNNNIILNLLFNIIH